MSRVIRRTKRKAGAGSRDTSAAIDSWYEKWERERQENIEKRTAAWEAAGKPSIFEAFHTYKISDINNHTLFMAWCDCWTAYNAIADVDREAAQKLAEQLGSFDGQPDYQLEFIAGRFREELPNIIDAKIERERIDAELEKQERTQREERERADREREKQAEIEREKQERTERERWDSLSPEEKRAEEIEKKRNKADKKNLPFLVSAADMEHSLPDLTYLIDGMIPEASYCMLYGLPKAYKSFTGLDIALSVAAGHDTWLNGSAINSGGYPVLYLDYENTQGLRQRIEAWCAAKNDSILPNNFYLIGNKILPKLGTDEFDRLIRQMQTKDDFFDLVVIDPVRAALGNEYNERQPDAAPALKAVVDKIRYTMQCPVLCLHHSTKDGSTYGGTNQFEGDVDAMFEIVDKGKHVELNHGPSRHNASGRPIKMAKRAVGDSLVLETLTEAKPDVAPAGIDSFVSQLDPGEYSIREAGRLMAAIPGCAYKPETLRKKIRESAFYYDGKIVVPEQ